MGQVLTVLRGQMPEVRLASFQPSLSLILSSIDPSVPAGCARLIGRQATLAAVCI